MDPKAGRVYVVDAGAYNIETAETAAGLVWVVDARSNRLIRTFAIGISPTRRPLSAPMAVSCSSPAVAGTYPV